MTQVFDHLPGAADLAQKHVVVAGSGTGMGGALSSLAGKVIVAGARGSWLRQSLKSNKPG